MHLQTNKDRFLEEWKFKRVTNKVKKLEKKIVNFCEFLFILKNNIEIDI